MALFEGTARCFIRVRSALRCVLASPALPMAFDIYDLSTTRFIRAINTNAPAAAGDIACDPWLKKGRESASEAVIKTDPQHILSQSISRTRPNPQIFELRAQVWCKAVFNAGAGS